MGRRLCPPARGHRDRPGPDRWLGWGPGRGRTHCDADRAVPPYAVTRRMAHEMESWLPEPVRPARRSSILAGRGRQSQQARSSWGPGMVRREVVIIEDDLDGSPGDETVRFGLDGAEYEIDLSGKNARKFRKRLAPFVEHAHRVAAGQRRPARTAASRQRSRDIRAWAKQQGIELSDRGRMPASIVNQYEASTGRTARRLARGRQARPGGRAAALSRFRCCAAGRWQCV